jgi:hypothetical protein
LGTIRVNERVQPLPPPNHLSIMKPNRHILPRLRGYFRLLLLHSFFAGIASVASGNDLALKWEELQKKFETASSEIGSKYEKERSELGGKYVGALQKFEATLQEKGELEELLTVRKERELFIASATPGAEGPPELSRLRTLYTESRAPIDKRQKEEIVRLMGAYLNQLETLQSELTRTGEIEAAVVVKNEGERIRRAIEAGEGPADGLNPKPADPAALARLQAIPEMNHAPADGDLFELEQWPPKVALPRANYRIEGHRYQGDELGREVLLLPGSVFRGADEKAQWTMGRATLVANEVEFDGFTFLGDLSSQLFFVKCRFKDMNLGKGGPWGAGRFMTRWQFRECRIEGSFTEKWNSKQFGLQMVNCEVERVEFPSIEYDPEDEASELAGQDWAMVRNTHFRKCVIPVSVLSLLDDCSFEECRFVDNGTPVNFASEIKRTVYLDNCQWQVKALPAGFVVEQKKISEKP